MFGVVCSGRFLLLCLQSNCKCLVGKEDCKALWLRKIAIFLSTQSSGELRDVGDGVEVPGQQGRHQSFTFVFSFAQSSMCVVFAMSFINTLSNRLVLLSCSSNRQYIIII